MILIWKHVLLDYCVCFKNNNQLIFETHPTQIHVLLSCDHSKQNKAKRLSLIHSSFFSQVRSQQMGQHRRRMTAQMQCLSQQEKPRRFIRTWPPARWLQPRLTTQWTERSLIKWRRILLPLAFLRLPNVSQCVSSSMWCTHPSMYRMFLVIHSWS